MAQRDLLDRPLSLQDMCMLCVVFQIEEFPVQYLALLPREIRRKLLFGLTHADVLHLAGTTLFDDVDSNRHYPHVSYARQCLLDVIMSGRKHTFFLSLHLKKALQWFSREEYRYNPHVESSLFDHICKCYSSLKPTKIRESYSSYFVLPKRSLAFVELEWEEDTILQEPVEYCHPVVLPLPLLNHCNVNFAPTELKIDCHYFKSSTFWKEFVRATRTTSANAIKGASSTVDLVFPLLQEFLSSVEVLELGTDNTPRDVDGLQKDMCTVPYVLLYNVLTSSQPRLKHIKVYGIPILAHLVLETILKLLHAKSYTLPRCGKVLSPLTTPYLLEGISVVPVSRGYGYGFEYMLDSFASSISRNVMSIVDIHKEKLTTVAVNDLGYCYSFKSLNVRELDDRAFNIRSKKKINVPSYRALLLSLVQFIKRPQFTNLNVGKSPSPEAYELIKAFLCTPAVHKQSLTIRASAKRSVPAMEKLKDEENTEDTKMEDGETAAESRKRQLVPESSEAPPEKVIKLNSPLKPDQCLPETNAQYKCLDLGFSSSCVYSWLFTLPELKLRELRMRTQDMTIVPANMVIQVEHVAFITETHFFTSYKPAISPAHLEKFVVSNLALKCLEFIEPTDDCAPGLIPALNHCLSILYQHGRGLEELIMNKVEFQNVEHLNEFLIRVRDVSHHHGTTLTLSLQYHQLVNSVVEESSLFENIAKEFLDKKIKKIDYTIRDKRDPSPHLSLIAEIVYVHCPRPTDESRYEYE